MIRVDINPHLLRWARKRSGIPSDRLIKKFNKLPEWELGKLRPTLNQLESYARTVHVPVGYLFLTEPPEETIPISDFRTPVAHELSRPSPNLLETIYMCQERQSWYRDFARVSGQPELDYVGHASLEASPESVANQMRERMGFDLAARKKSLTWTDALRQLIRQAEKVGVLVMVSGVVRSNNRRHLDPAEFRGFALSDSRAPLVFINGRDTKAAQMFTLAHELAHIWLGASALSNLGITPRSGFRPEEEWCNAAAAEFLVPLHVLQTDLQPNELLPDTLSRLARAYKVSTFVILRRLLDAEWIEQSCFDAAWGQEKERLKIPAGGRGGNFYHTTQVRVSRRFARALVVSTLEGHTLYRDAFRMLGVRKTKTFNELGRQALPTYWRFQSAPLLV